MKIREMHIEDVKKVSELINKDISVLFCCRKKITPVKMKEMFLSGKKSGYHYFIAEENGEIAGYLCFNETFEENLYYLSQIIVSEKFRRRDVARSIMDFLLSDLKKRGAKKVNAEVVYDNVSMRKLLAEYLFVPEGLFRGQMNWKDEIRYALWLSKN